jgi:hypothetical protein
MIALSGTFVVRRTRYSRKSEGRAVHTKRVNHAIELKVGAISGRTVSVKLL